MTSPVHVDNVTQWLQMGAQLFMSCEFGTGMLWGGTVDVHAHVKIHREKVNSISVQTDSVACGWCCEIAGCMVRLIEIETLYTYNPYSLWS